MLLLATTYIRPLNHPGIMDEYHWSAFNWIESNTPMNSKILFLYGDTYYSQTSRLYSTKRAVYKVEFDYLKGRLNNKSVDRLLPISIGVHNLLGKPAYMKSFLSFEAADFQETEMGDLCDFDYYVIDLMPQINQIPQLIELNIYLGNLFQKNGFVEVYNNQVVSILRNQDKGDCLA
jgi:hypothetical protein